MDPRTVPTTTATVTPAAVSPDDRPEAHNSSIDEKVAETGACGQVHLQSGRTCTLEHRHQGACDFVPRPEVQDSVAQHRAADGW
jgi:hypothetical protein